VTRRIVIAFAAVLLMSAAMVAPAFAEAPAGKPGSSEATARKPGSAEARDPFSFTLGDAIRLAIGARMAIDVRGSDDSSDSNPDTTRRRIGVDGSIGKRIDFAIERELDGDHPWRDVYADVRIQKALRLRAGQFKVPFSLEETTGVKHLDFIDRSLAATQLAPGRDVGVMGHGRVWRKRVEYEGGVFRRDGDGPSLRHPERTHGTTTAAGRLSMEPFASAKRSLGDLRVAFAATTSSLPEGISNLRGRTAWGDRFFPATYWAAGRRQRTGAEARWRPGPFTVTAEYMRVTDQRRGQALDGGDLAPLTASGWYVAGVWRVPRAIGPGSHSRVELAARVEQLAFGSGGTGVMSLNPRADRVVSAADRAVTLGLNWWITRYAKVLVNAVHERVRSADSLAGQTPVRRSLGEGGWTPVFSVQLGL
jgi:phosphate-selective porin